MDSMTASDGCAVPGCPHPRLVANGPRRWGIVYATCRHHWLEALYTALEATGRRTQAVTTEPPLPELRQYPRRLTRDGYVLVRLASGRWQYEHRYVAERMLNRPLAPTEYVVHRNYLHNDNRPENLLIRVRHPKPAPPRAQCPVCQRVIPPQRARSRFCSRACYQRAWRVSRARDTPATSHAPHCTPPPP